MNAWLRSGPQAEVSAHLRDERLLEAANAVGSIATGAIAA